MEFPHPRQVRGEIKEFDNILETGIHPLEHALKLKYYLNFHIQGHLAPLIQESFP